MPSRRTFTPMARTLAGLCGLALLAAPGCIGSGGSNSNADSSSSARKRTFPLDTLKTTTLTLNGRPIRAWLATTDDQRMEGLMYVTDAEIADDQGMLFVFENEERRGFWMKNTIIPLDIAFMRGDGLIVKTHTMPPLTLDSFPSEQPARFALELKSGTLAKLNVRTGDTIVIPPEVLKP